MQPGRELYTVAVASDESIPDLTSLVVLADPDPWASWKYWERVRTRGKEEHVHVLMGRLEAARAESSRLAARVAELEGLVATMQGTVSWRLTSPLRALRAFLARLR